MRLEMMKEMQIEILNGGEISVNCKFQFNKNLNFEFVQRDTSEFKSNPRLNSTLYREIPKKFDFLDY